MRGQITDLDRLAVIDRAYELLEPTTAELEAAELNPDRPDVVAHWNSMRPKPQPPPRVPKLDTAKRFDAICDSRADARIAAVFKSFLADDGFLADALGRCFAQERERTSKQLRELRRELIAAHRKIEKMEREKAAPTIAGWKIDRKMFRLIPFMSDGRPGTPIPLRGLFEEYHAQVSS